MERSRVFVHAAALGLEAILLLALIDVRLAFLCRWCGTPPQPREPILPAAFWHEVFGFQWPSAYCVTADVEGLVVLAGAALAAHAFYVINGGRRTSRP
jgi:hypothetical protein